MSIYFEATLKHGKFQRALVNHLGYTDDDGNGQSKSGSKVLLGHSDETSIGPYYEDDTRWRP